LEIFVPECTFRTLEKLITGARQQVSMNDSSDLVDYIKEVRLILADSIDTLLNLEYDVLYEKDDEIVLVSSVVDLVNMSYDVAETEKLKNAESGLLERQAT
jgi:hypothetical protein